MKPVSIMVLTGVLFLGSCNGMQQGSNELQEEQVQNKVVDLTPDEFEKGMESANAFLLDVRTSGEVVGGKIANATHIDFYGANFLKEVEKVAIKSVPVYVYCKSGGRSSSAAKKLLNAGFTNVYNLEGGISSWKRAGKKVN